MIKVSVVRKVLWRAEMVALFGIDRDSNESDLLCRRTIRSGDTFGTCVQEICGMKQ